MSKERVLIEAEVLHATDEAVLLDHGEDEPTWVPKSVAEENEDGDWLVEEWFALKEGMV